jgi:hypothetical protein
VGLILFLFNRATTTDVVIAAAVSLAGAVGVIIPIVNMISISLPRENVATGLGLPHADAFDYVFYLGIASMVAVLIFSLAAKNYVFRKQAQP